MVKVFITVDTEIWPDSPKWPRTSLAAGRDLARLIDWYFYGGEGKEPRGIPYQLRTLADAGLMATCFVDPLFADVRPNDDGWHVARAGWEPAGSRTDG